MFLLRWASAAFASLIVLMLANTAFAAPPWSPREISSDPFTGDGAQHATQVEPDTFSSGSTVVAAFQSGRFFFGGGATAIGVATSNDAGKTWTSSFLPSLTVATGGSADRATDPSVAYDARHNVWLISSLRLSGPFSTTDYVVSRSTDHGLTWSAPVIASPANPSPPPTNAHDKGWIVCDDTSSSPFYGRCYLAFSDFVNGRASVVRSDDGGLSWSAPVGSADSASGVGLQPVVQPSGTVVIPYLRGPGMRSIRSRDGGVSFEASVPVASVTSHVPTGMRALPIPSSEVDGAGRVYVAWQDCRFRPGCVGPSFPAPNDIVYATSDDGVSWSAVRRIPIDRTTSGVDHFIPGLGVSSATQGAGADLAVAYYYFRNGGCTVATCELRVGFTASRNGGKRWRHPRRLSGPMPLSWIADTNFGANSHMVGDYISTSFVAGSSVAVPVFSLASAPGGSTLRQSIWASAIRVQKH
jgi:hypothetical protein